MFARFSETAGQFVFSDENDDGVPITEEEHAALLAWQAAGRTVSVGAGGVPMLNEPHRAKTVFARFSESDGRFAFSDEDNGGIQITTEAHDALMAGQATGKVIVAGKDGAPVLIDRVLSTGQRTAALVAAVQSMLDAEARALGYDDIKTAVTYADEPAIPSFQAQGQALRAWRSRVWAGYHDLLAKWEAGEMSEPSAEELITLLPTLKLPR